MTLVLPVKFTIYKLSAGAMV